MITILSHIIENKDTSYNTHIKEVLPYVVDIISIKEAKKKFQEYLVYLKMLDYEATFKTKNLKELALTNIDTHIKTRAKFHPTHADIVMELFKAARYIKPNNLLF